MVRPDNQQKHLIKAEREQKMLRYSYITNHISISPHKNHKKLILYLFLHVEKLRLREVKQIAQGY